MTNWRELCEELIRLDRAIEQTWEYEFPETKLGYVLDTDATAPAYTAFEEQVDKIRQALEEAKVPA